jgi:hypothetical protein
MTDLGHWKTDIEIPEDPFGFIYIITNLKLGKHYVGKKQMKSVKKMPPLKGKKNKRHKDVQTDWKTYTGSSNDLNADIEKYGKENFTFTILRFCENKWSMAYHETKLQFQYDVLVSENFYNGIINCRIGKAPKGSILDHG